MRSLSGSVALGLGLLLGTFLLGGSARGLLAGGSPAQAAGSFDSKEGCATIIEQGMYKTFYDRGAAPDEYMSFTAAVCSLTLTADLYPALPASEYANFQQVVAQLAPNLKSTRWSSTSAFLDYWTATNDPDVASATAMGAYAPYARVRMWCGDWHSCNLRLGHFRTCVRHARPGPSGPPQLALNHGIQEDALFSRLVSSSMTPHPN